jgi:hypothetical protein
MSSAAFVVKSVYQGDYRRFKLLRPSYELLRQSLTVSYPELPVDFTVKYTDDEGDLCLITSDMELAEAAHVAKGSPMKVTVCAKPSSEVLVQDEKEEPIPLKKEEKEEVPEPKKEKEEVPVPDTQAKKEEKEEGPKLDKKNPL